jgi:hypothetical protein
MSQYDKSFQEPVIPPTPSYSSWDTVPIHITIDNYGIIHALNDDTLARRSRQTFEFEGTNGINAGLNVGCGAIRDVVSIELIRATVPINAAEIYTILRVNNYSNVKSSNPFAKNSFCIIPLDNPSMDDYYTISRTSNKPDDRYTYYFPEPTRISKLDIEFVSPTGDEIIFEETTVVNDPDTGDPEEVTQHTNYVLVFEIRTLNRAPKPESRFQNCLAGKNNSPWQ